MATADPTSTLPEDVSERHMRGVQWGRRTAIAALFIFLALGAADRLGDSARGIILRATGVYFLLLTLIRAMGKRELSQLTPFEFLLLVLTGDLTQNGIMQEDETLVGAAVAVGTIAFWVLCMSYLDFRWPRTRGVVEGLPVIIIRDGQLLHDRLRFERVPVAEVLVAAREHGIDDLRKVRVGILECDGQFSFIGPEEQDEPIRHGQG